MGNPETWLDQLAQSPAWDGVSLDRLIPLLEAARYTTVSAGDVVFEQFHPATTFYFLASGAATQTTTSTERTELVQFAPVDWCMGALGWSGFLLPRRYGSTASAVTDLELYGWNHDRLARIFYSDPELACRFFDLVLDSVRRQIVSLRQRRVDMTGTLFDPPSPEPWDARRPVVAGPVSLLQRTAFFAPFDDESVEALAATAELQSYGPGERIVGQDDAIDGILVLASGRCSASFETGGTTSRLLPFRRINDRAGIIAGLPLQRCAFAAESTVYADTHCWVFRIPADGLRRAFRSDPEFGRAFQQRLLVRMAGLIDAIKMERDFRDGDPEVAAVVNTLANSRARLPVTSQLHKVPHLLQHRLTIGNAFAVLKNVAETGRYHERLLASRCYDLIENLAAEDAFYQQILGACQYVIGVDESTRVEEVRAECDRRVAEAFGYLDVRIHGEENLPRKSGSIFVLNHLSCPEYYQLPNDYHFSFDTAFVSCLVWKHFGKSAVRVVRESPGIEFGHNLFYQRLGHITVPTVESQIDGLGEEEFRRLRREAGERFARAGSKALASGNNLIICPEGQSQPVERSPARFHTGAFRLAESSGADVVPVGLAGFHRRFKDGPLVGIVGRPVNVAEAMNAGSHPTIRDFVDGFRDRFSALVAEARSLADEPAILSHPD